MNSKKSNGPRLLPCGTPEDIILGWEKLFLIRTKNCLLVIYEWIHKIHEVSMLRLCIFWIRREWQTLSKAFSKSRKMASVCLLSSRFSAIVLVNMVKLVVTDKFLTKPCCLGVIRWMTRLYNCLVNMESKILAKVLIIAIGR